MANDFLTLTQCYALPVSQWEDMGWKGQNFLKKELLNNLLAMVEVKMAKLLSSPTLEEITSGNKGAYEVLQLIATAHCFVPLKAYVKLEWLELNTQWWKV